MLGSTAAIRPCAMPTSRTAERLFLASVTWPPFRSRAHGGCASAAETRASSSPMRIVSHPGVLTRRIQDLTEVWADNQFCAGLHRHGDDLQTVVPRRLRIAARNR